MVMSVRRNSLAFMGDECQVRQGPQHLQRRVDRLLADTRESGDEGSGRTEPDADGNPGCDAAEGDEEIAFQLTRLQQASEAYKDIVRRSDGLSRDPSDHRASLLGEDPQGDAGIAAQRTQRGATSGFERSPGAAPGAGGQRYRHRRLLAGARSASRFRDWTTGIIRGSRLLGHPHAGVKD